MRRKQCVGCSQLMSFAVFVIETVPQKIFHHVNMFVGSVRPLVLQTEKLRHVNEKVNS